MHMAWVALTFEGTINAEPHLQVSEQHILPSRHLFLGMSGLLFEMLNHDPTFLKDVCCYQILFLKWKTQTSVFW